MRLTITEVAESIHRQHGGEIVPAWKMRRVIDSLDTNDAISIQRVGIYRTVAESDVAIIAAELQRLGWLAPESEAATCQR
ncbi:hypothetical protein [Schlesneria paludicola]|uniref:hypothetical protein n=1 Tax=Schlesneria paludicola TaxID=360056 RepID=UPI00029AF87D|nr:hypothetical protein [Schlesneria paludicola]